jgi:hypothetical protein
LNALGDGCRVELVWHGLCDRCVVEDGPVDKVALLGRLKDDLQVLIELQDLDFGNSHWNKIGNVLVALSVQDACGVDDAWVASSHISVAASEVEIKSKLVRRWLTGARCDSEFLGVRAEKEQ